MEIKTNPVNSSNIKAIGFMDKTLQIDFWNGSSYQYNPVTDEGYRELIKADSIGAHFNKNIKNNDRLTCTKIKDKIIS